MQVSVLVDVMSLCWGQTYNMPNNPNMFPMFHTLQVLPFMENDRELSPLENWNAWGLWSLKVRMSTLWTESWRKENKERDYNIW
jgi:hypothetical protein